MTDSKSTKADEAKSKAADAASDPARGHIDRGNPADDGFYDTEPGAEVNEGKSDMVNEDGK